jgi:hypothetical protein
LLVKVSGMFNKGVPKGAKDITPKDARIVLAYGEVTGHAHALEEAKVGKAKLWDAGAERFLQVLEKTALTHEEHSAITLEPGVYKVTQQREYAPEDAARQRLVAD